MYVIVGLGNPGREYAHTRHNVGFDVVSALADKYGIVMDYQKHKAVCGKGMIEGQKVILAQPLTYMNLSGESVRQLVDYYKIDPQSELIVVYDDIDLNPGMIRVRPKGSPGGHNGMKNIVQHMSSQEFLRVRVGVGAKPKEYDLKDYVLGHFAGEDRKLMDAGIDLAVEAVAMLLTDTIDHAMNKFNKAVKRDTEE